MPVRPEDVDTGVFAAAQVEGRALLRAKDFVGAAAVFTAALAKAESAAKPFFPSPLSPPSPATEQQQPPQLQKAATKGAAAAAAAENSSQLLWSIEEAGASGTRLLLAKAWWCNGDSTRALSIIEELITKAESTTTTTTDANNGASIGSSSSSSSSLVPGSALHHEVYRTLAKLTLELVEQADGERLGGGGAEAAAAAAAAAAADVARRPTQQQLDAAVAACCLIAPALSAKGREGAFELSLIYEYKAKLHTAGCSCGSAAAAAPNHPPCSCGKLLQARDAWQGAVDAGCSTEKHKAGMQRTKRGKNGKPTKDNKKRVQIEREASLLAVMDKLGLIDHAAEAAAAAVETEKREDGKRRQRRKRAKRAAELDNVLDALGPAAAARRRVFNSLCTPDVPAGSAAAAAVATCMRVDALNSAAADTALDILAIQTRHAALRRRMEAFPLTCVPVSVGGNGRQWVGSTTVTTAAAVAPTALTPTPMRVLLPSQSQYTASISIPATASVTSVLARELPPRLDWKHVPAVLQPSSTEDGGLGHNASRVQRKEWQLESLFNVLFRTVQQLKANRAAAAASSDGGRGATSPITIVDFGSGSGNSALPFAALLPDCNFVLLDEKLACVAIGQRRTDDSGLTNVKWEQGDVSDYTDVFDIGLATHLCGEATDLAQAKCIENKAAFILTPCCVGKIKHLLVKSGGGTIGNVDSSGVSGSADVDGDDHNLDHDHDGLGGRNLESLGAAAADSKVQGGPGGGGGGVGGGDGANGGGSSGGGDGDAAASSKRSYHRRRYVDSQVKRALKYPRSEWLRSVMTVDDYVKLVRLSDYNQHYVSGSQLASKEIMDADRLAAAAEVGYATGIGKLWPAECSPKNDVLVGYPAGYNLEALFGVR